MGDRRRLEAAAALALLDAPGYGPGRVHSTIDEAGGSAVAAFEALLDERANSAKTNQLSEFVRGVTLESYLGVLDRTEELGGDWVLWSDSDYPANLSRWAARPPVLFYKGDLRALGTRSLALVGRVDPTPEGVAAATRFGRKCVQVGIDVVSGLAKGIDAASHRSALMPPPGRTFAVVGHGIDFAYPRENSDLYEQIPSGGAIISQFMTGVGPQRWTFPARNEVMCTIALGTVIIEGKPGCGSIIQAGFSFKHGRPVFLLSRNLKVGETEWAEKLVADGAHVVESFQQVIDLVEATHGDLWGPRQQAQVVVQSSLFDTPASGTDERPRVAIFDIDGVIVDTRQATAGALAQIASRHTGRTVAAGEVDVTGKPHDALTRLGVRGAYDIYKAEYDAAFQAARGDIQVFEQAVESLRRLAAEGVRLAAVTAQPKRRADVMLPPAVRDLFEAFLCYNDTKGKKDVGIAMVLRRFDAGQQDALYVGDQQSDVTAAKAAGVQAVAVTWGFGSPTDLAAGKPDATASTPRELADKVLGLLRTR